MEFSNRSSLRTQGPIRRGLSLRHSSRGLFSLLRPGVMGPCVRRDDVLRSVLLATALLAALPAAASAQVRNDVIAAPVLRADVTVSGDLVRIGDVIDNAGTSALIAIYRAPDLGTTGSLPTAQVISALRAHQVIGVDTRDIGQISVTRPARTLQGKDIELQVARALEHKGGLGEAADLSL